MLLVLAGYYACRLFLLAGQGLASYSLRCHALASLTDFETEDTKKAAAGAGFLTLLRGERGDGVWEAVPVEEETDITPVPEPTEALEVLGTPLLAAISAKKAALSSLSFDAVRSQYFIVDQTTSFPEDVAALDTLLFTDVSMNRFGGGKILIYHTHGSEGYIDSKAGETADTVIGVGEALAAQLRALGYEVIHDRTAYDVCEGQINRDVSYNQALDGLTKQLMKHPDIEVMIDLHRDSGEKRVCTIDGTEMAQLMLFNGLCRTNSGPMSKLTNPNLVYNLAFGLQCKIIGEEAYPGLFKKNYLKGYRYNMHLRQRAMLVEVGTGQNTVAEAYRAMTPFAKVLDLLLQGAGVPPAGQGDGQASKP